MKKITRKALAAILSATLLISCISTVLIFPSAETTDRILTVNVTKTFDTESDANIAYIGLGQDSEGNDIQTPSDTSVPHVEDGALKIPSHNNSDISAKVFTFSDLYDAETRTITSVDSFELDLLPSNIDIYLVSRFSLTDKNEIDMTASSQLRFLKQNGFLSYKYSKNVAMGTQSGWGYVESGSQTKPENTIFDLSQSIHIKMEKANRSKLLFTFSQGDNNVVINITNDHIGAVSPFYLVFRSPHNTNNCVIDNVSYSYTKDYTNDSQLNAFLTDNAEILTKTVDNVTADDETAVKEALADYNAMTDTNKQKALETEKTLLDSLAAKVAELKEAASKIDESVTTAKNSLATTGKYTADMDYAGKFMDVSNEIYTPKTEFTIPGISANTVSGSFVLNAAGDRVDLISNYKDAARYGFYASITVSSGVLAGTRGNGSIQKGNLANNLKINGESIPVGTTIKYSITYAKYRTNLYAKLTLMDAEGVQFYNWAAAMPNANDDYSWSPENTGTFALRVRGTPTLGDISVDYGDILPEMQGASVLMNAETIEGQNLRFDALIPEGSNDLYTYKRSGMVIMMEYYLNGQTLVSGVASNLEGRENIVAKTIDCTETVTASDGEHIYVELLGTGIVSSEDTDFYGYAYCARAYSVYEDAAGNEIYVYSANNYTKTAAIDNSDINVIENGVSTSSVTRVMRNICKIAYDSENPAEGDTLTAINKTSGTTKQEVALMYAYAKTLFN